MFVILRLISSKISLSFYHLGNYRLAITYFDKALAINPKNVAALTGKKQALALPMPELL
jgi:tetratricopeptide (TPR) repeat protein